MSKKSGKPLQILALAVAALTLATVSRVEAQTVFFSDNYTRANSTNMDVSTNGMGGIVITSGALPVGGANQSPWSVPTDYKDNLTNDAIVVANQMRTGGNSHTVYMFPAYNFANLVATGIVSVTATFVNSGPSGAGTAPTNYDRYDGIGVGFSVATANAGGGTDRWMQNDADLFVEETSKGIILVYDGVASGRNLGVNYNFAVPLNGAAGVYYDGTLRIDLMVTNTIQGSNVVYNVLWNGGSGFTNVITGRTFVWSGTSAFCAGTEERSQFAVTNSGFTVSSSSYTPPPVTAITWRATQDNNWNTTSVDWVDSAVGLSSYAFFTGANVTFNDITASSTVNIPGPVAPGNITVSCVNSNYVFSGSGSIGGTGVLAMIGTGTLDLGMGNSFSGGATLTAGHTLVGNNNALGSGTLTLGGGELSSDGATARTLGNAVLITASSTLGDLVDTGMLTLTNLVNLNGGTPTLTVNSPTVITGGATNGVISVKQGPGPLTISGAVFYNNTEDVVSGTLIYSNAVVSSSARVVADAATNSEADLIITNGSVVTNTTANGNLRAGHLGALNGTNYVDLAGVYSTPNADAADGYVVLFGACNYAQVTFWPGGDYVARGVTNYEGVGSTVFNFNGGILRAAQNTPNFLEGLSAAYVEAGGGTIDDRGFAITINQNLLDGSAIGGGSGGLTKIGAGTLTLAGNNSFAGPSVVNNGTLVISNTAFGSGSLTVASNATLNIAYNGNYITPSTLNAGFSTTNAVTIDFVSTPSPGGAPAVYTPTINGTGTCLINIQGINFGPGTYPLLWYTGSITGSNSFVLGSLPAGVSATLQQIPGQINLVVTVVPKNLDWSGAVSANWDLSTYNWYDLNNGNNPTNYAQSGTAGDMVTFDDNGSANPNISLGITVTPSQLLFNNSSVNYAFSGPGGIAGGVGLVKESTSSGSVALSTANSYTGGTDLQGGNLYVGNNHALGLGTVLVDGLSVELASASTSPVTLTNPVVLTANATTVLLGDTVNSGPLTLAGPFDFGSYVGRTLTVNSNVILAGTITNTGGGGASTLSGNGLLTITGHGQIGVGGNPVTETSANVLFNGGVLIDLDAWRLQGGPGDSVTLTLTNGAVLYITNAPAANLRVGLAGGDATASNTLDVAATVNLWGTGGNGTVYLGGSGISDTFNLRTGGIVRCYSVSQAGATLGTANFYGGTLVPITNNTAFMQGLSNAYIWNGLTVDTTNFNITIPQPLLAAGAGGLTKNGAGILTLSGSNSYTGGTVVNAGKLVLVPGFYAPGSFTVNGNATLDFQQSASNTVDVASVSIGSGANSALEADLTSTNTPAGMITNLILNGAVQVNVTNLINVTNLMAAGTIPLFGYSTISGSGSLAVGQLPPGVSGTITTNTVAKTINLTIASAAPTVPHITTLTYSGTYLGIAGTNGNANGTYYVLSSTNIAIPLTNWTMAYTGTFSATGSFTNSLPISASTPQNFFLIKNP